ncbi:hypothetical protein PR048_028923 [Dryococelus australis]|uniref:Uncharacterized protein n=1 Tax=Dryococelus australis TaxID=614101 RepID=A0ABQ9GBX6_9NEOP|nr:hypothetical protein PR048_028923 [Dryococelus australis]
MECRCAGEPALISIRKLALAWEYHLPPPHPSPSPFFPNHFFLPWIASPAAEPAINSADTLENESAFRILYGWRTADTPIAAIFPVVWPVVERCGGAPRVGLYREELVQSRTQEPLPRSPPAPRLVAVNASKTLTNYDDLLPHSSAHTSRPSTCPQAKPRASVIPKITDTVLPTHSVNTANILFPLSTLEQQPPRPICEPNPPHFSAATPAAYYVPTGDYHKARARAFQDDTRSEKKKPPHHQPPPPPQHPNFTRRMSRLFNFTINHRKKSLLLPAYTLTDALGDMRPVKMVLNSNSVYLSFAGPAVAYTTRLPSRRTWFYSRPGSPPGFRIWVPCGTMPLVGGFSRGSPSSPPLHSGAAPHSPRFTLIGSQNLDVKILPNLFTGSEFVPCIGKSNPPMVNIWYGCTTAYGKHKLSKNNHNYRTGVQESKSRHTGVANSFPAAGRTPSHHQVPQTVRGGEGGVAAPAPSLETDHSSSLQPPVPLAPSGMRQIPATPNVAFQPLKGGWPPRARTLPCRAKLATGPRASVRTLPVDRAFKVTLQRARTVPGRAARRGWSARLRNALGVGRAERGQGVSGTHAEGKEPAHARYPTIIDMEQTPEKTRRLAASSGTIFPHAKIQERPRRESSPVLQGGKVSSLTTKPQRPLFFFRGACVRELRHAVLLQSSPPRG